MTTGVESLVAGTDSLIAGQAAKLSITATPKKGTTGPGPIRFESTSDEVTLQGADGCKQQGDASVVCDGTGFTLVVDITKNQSAGALPVGALDAGGRELDLTTTSGKPVQVVAAPSGLILSDLTVREPFTSLLVGSVTLTVTNPGDRPSPIMPITVTPSADLQLVLVSSFTRSGFYACSSILGQQCFLPPIAAKESRTFDFMVAGKVTTDSSVTVVIDGTSRSTSIWPFATATVAPDLPASTPVTTTVSSPAVTRETTPAELTVTALGPVDSASDSANDTDATDPAPTGATKTVLSTETLPTDPSSDTPTNDPTTFESSSQADEASESSSPDTTDAELPPAALTFSGESISQTLTAGAAGELRLTVTNAGGQRSEQQPVAISLPAGVSTTRVTVDGSVGGADSPQTCTLPEIEPGMSVTVVVEIAVDPGVADTAATDGITTLTVDGNQAQGYLTIVGRPAEDQPTKDEPAQPADVLQQVGRQDEAAPGS